MGGTSLPFPGATINVNHSANNSLQPVALAATGK